MASRILFPRGATLAISGLYRDKATRTPISIQGAELASAWREERCGVVTNAEVENLDDGTEENRGRYRVEVAAELTAAWPPRPVVGDIRIEYPDGTVTKSPLVTLEVTESPTP